MVTSVTPASVAARPGASVAGAIAVSEGLSDGVSPLRVGLTLNRAPWVMRELAHVPARPVGRAEGQRRRTGSAAARSLRVRAADTAMRYVASRCCTTRRLDAHGTAERTLLYPWHPWAGLSVRVCEVIERGTGSALRCSLGEGAGRHLEVPAWMFERSVCVPLMVTGRPRGCAGALRALRQLLTEVSGRGVTDASASVAGGRLPRAESGRGPCDAVETPAGECEGAECRSPTCSVRLGQQAARLRRRGGPCPREHGGR
jgi:hypothetical protein